MAQLILASQSPRRQELLRRIGVEHFTVLPTDSDESWDPSWSPEELVGRLSARKAAAAARAAGPEGLVLAADTMVFLDDRRLGKPADEAEAFEMLSALSGREHTVWTGVTVRRGDRADTRSEATAVRFRTLTAEEIRAYIATGEPMDKAGAYGVQGKGALLVQRLEGDFFNVMGLPVLRLSRLLEQFGIHLLA